MRDGVYEDDPAPRRVSGYVVWLIASLVIVAAVVAYTVVVQASIPAGCGPCGMVMVGMAPFWLFAFLCLVANVMVIAVHLIRHRREQVGVLMVVSWAYGAASMGVVAWLVIDLLVGEVF